MGENNLSPVRFNPLKHHLGWLLQQIERWKQSDHSTVIEELKSLGENQFDLYTGELSCAEIRDLVLQALQTENISAPASLQKWLGSRGYKTMTFPDGSVWIIRCGTNPELYIHLHPARNQPMIKRIKANHLKTVVGLLLAGDSVPEQVTGQNEKINRIRRQELGLSPVKSLVECRRIVETWRFFAQRCS
ncbi:MAG TPA: hypothetical protein PK167_08450 [Prolixibacteraceae bacterium]|nr:hypothetical protein [Prolixibacteraceae bacterium]